jgi:general secretion pathway protein D
MIKAAPFLTGLCLLASPLAFAQPESAETPAAPAPVPAPPPARVVVAPSAPLVSDSEAAVAESVRRQAAKVMLRQQIAEAQAAENRRDTPTAARLYSKCWDLILSIGTDVDQEIQVVRSGAGRTHMDLAYAAQRAGNLHEADVHIKELLRIDPSNVAALDFKANNDKLILAAIPNNPSPETEALVPSILAANRTNAQLVQDAKLLFDLGKYDEAEFKAKTALRNDPTDRAARYYLNLIQDARFREHAANQDLISRKNLVDVEKEWITPNRGKDLPVPNQYARNGVSGPFFTGMAHGRNQIMAKLDRIRLDFPAEGVDALPLSEIVKILSDEAKKRDPEKKGVNFLVNPNTDVGVVVAPSNIQGGAPGAPNNVAPPPTAVDPATGLPLPTAAPEPVDVGAISIKISPRLIDVRLADVLDAISKVAEKHIRYSVEDYAVVFSLKGAEPSPLFTRIINVDPNTFVQGLESVGGVFIQGGSSQGGGGGGGGGGGQGGQGGGATIPRVDIAAATQTGQGGGGGGGGGQAGRAGIGIQGVTRTNDMATVNTLVRLFFTSSGVDLTPPKSIYFNDRVGRLVVYATLADIDRIEQAIQVLNATPPQVTISAKFVEITQNDQKALGFEYYLGNVLMNNSSMGLQGGTAPSFNGRPTTANPEGTFPGSAINGTAIAPAASDQLITTGLRNQVGIRNPSPVPTLATLSGILTDPQFRVILHAIEQRDGVDLLNESIVTTVSGRQCQMSAVDVATIVSGNNTQTGAGGGGGITGGNAGTFAQVNPQVTVVPIGPTLDVVPYVSADGFTVQMTLIPTMIDFLGYDDPGAFVTQAQISGTGSTLTATLPLPRFRLRQVTTSAIVWDGQTVVLGGLISEDLTKIKDKLPILGDLPFVGRLFRSESTTSSKRNLMIFVTPTIIDPAGNRVHSEDEMPFNVNTLPTQPVPLAPAGQ